MKRILLSIVSLLISLAGMANGITSLDELDNTKYYYIQQASDNQYVYANSSTSYTMGTASSGTTHQWAVYKSTNSGNYYFYNLSTGKFMTANGSTCPLQSDAVPVFLLPGKTAGEWYAYSASYVIGQNAAAGANAVLLTNSIANYEVPAFSFTEGGALTAAQQNAVAAKVYVYEAGGETVNVISSIGSAISDLSALTDGSTVLLYSNGKGKYTYDNGSYLYFGSTPSTNDINAMKYVFTVSTDGTNYTFRSGAGNYIYTLQNGTIVNTSSTNEGSFTITASSGTANCFNLYSTTSGTYLNANPDKPVGWSSSEGNSLYKFIPVTITASSTVYSAVYDCYLTDGTNEKSLGAQVLFNNSNTYSAPTFSGATLSSMTNLATGATVSSSNTYTSSVAVKALYTSNAAALVTPTTVSNGTFADNATWYRIYVNGKLLCYDEKTARYYTLNRTAQATFDDADLWCFDGNNVTGYVLYNKKAGAAVQPLTYTANLVNGDVPYTGNEENLWVVSQNGSACYLTTAEDGFYLCNDGQGKVSLYKSSSYKNVAIEPAGETMKTNAELYANEMGNYVGMFKENNYTSTLTAAASGYTTASPTATTFSNLQTAYNNFMNNAERVTLRNDRLYVIASVGTSGKSIRPSGTGASQVVGVAKDMANTNQYWRFLQLGNSGEYYLLSPYAGGYLDASSGNKIYLTTSAPTHPYLITNYGTTLSQWLLQDQNASTANRSYLNYKAATNILTGWTGADASDRWQIVPVDEFPVTVSASGFATTCLPFNALPSSGLQVFAIESATPPTSEDGIATLSAISGVVPAATPVVLYAKGGGDFTLNATDTEGTAPAANLLQGTPDMLTTVGANNVYVVWDNDNNTPGFYKYTADQLAPFKAYLSAEVLAAAGVSRLLLSVGEEGTTTDINAATEGKAQRGSEIFDLQGRRVTKMQKGGIYIVGGKKIVN